MLTELNPPKVLVKKPLELTSNFIYALDSLCAPEEGLPLLKGSFSTEGGGCFLLKVARSGAVLISDCAPPIDVNSLGGAFMQCNASISNSLYMVNLDAALECTKWSLRERGLLATTLGAASTLSNDMFVSVSGAPSANMSLSDWAKWFISSHFSKDSALCSIAGDYFLSPDALTLAQKVWGLKPDAETPAKIHFDSMGSGIVMTSSITGPMGCGEMRVYVPFAQCHTDSAFQSKP
mgnify:CR=1 FL=1